MTRPILLALVALVAGCGSKSGLTVPDPQGDGGSFDAGVDAGPDAETDAGMDGGPMPDECIELPFLEPPRELEILSLIHI